MRSILLSLLLAASIALCSHAAQAVDVGEDDRVLDLPWWDEALPSKWYSGHVYAGQKEGKELYHHYMLVESESNPAKDPVVVWSNGGPGASSLFGLMVELGPLLITGKSKGRLIRNDYAWNKNANLVILNGPPPVGFSYCTPPGPTGDFRSCGAWNDSATAHHNRIAIESLVKRHPRLRSLPWFFTGESYAGVYIPTLVRELLDHSPKLLNIKGMALGNACMGTDVLCFSDADYWWRAVFLRGHAQVSDASYSKFESKCRAAMERSIVTKECKQMVESLEKEAGGFYEYDLFSECWYDGDFAAPSALPTLRGRRLTGGGDDFCGGDDALSAWLSTPQVRRALNVRLDSVFCSADNGVSFDYAFTERDLRPFYKHLIKNKLMRVVVYSGDTDVSVNVFASQNWTRTLGIKEKEAWRPWTLDGRRAVVGYVTKYENDFDFVTIRGSGHMVPQFKAKASFEMLQRFLKKDALKRYDPKAKKPPVPPVALRSSTAQDSTIVALK